MRKRSNAEQSGAFGIVSLDHRRLAGVFVLFGWVVWVQLFLRRRGGLDCGT
jgi:hypothetical protein